MKNKQKTNQLIKEELRKTKEELDIQKWGLKKTLDGAKALIKERIQKQNELKKAYGSVEKKVQERTASLNKAQERIQKQINQLKELDKSKTQFLSITSHELRSPMTSMKAQLQMVLAGYFGKINKKQKESIEIVIRNTDRLDNLIQDLLESSRIQAARLKFNYIKTSLTPYFERLIKEMKLFIPENNIRIVSEIGKLPVMEADPYRIMQVLRNLIDNAVKFSNKNSKVIVTAEKRAGEILFSVKDFGIGIAKENQAKIFKPFSQEEQTISREYGGTGLGLSICKGIVEAQNGKIWFESEKGKGTIFYFTVPLKPVKGRQADNYPP